MPIRFNSITNHTDDPRLLEKLLGTVFNNCNSAFVSADKRHFIARSEMTDRFKGNVIGQYVYTIFSNVEEGLNEILDIDVTLTNETPVDLHFLERLPISSDSNEYYEAELLDGGQHLEIETVNRYTVEGEIVGKVRPVYISVFPYELSVYEDIDEFNRIIGFQKRHPIGKTNLFTSGLSDTFIAPGGMLSTKDTEPHTFLIGTVEEFRDVIIRAENLEYPVVLADVRTALGIVPVAMGREVFDLDTLDRGKVVAMRAHIKADLSKPSDWLC